MKLNSKIDALSLMLTDLRTRNEPIRLTGNATAGTITAFRLPKKR